VYRKGWGALFYALTGRELDTVLPQCCGYRARPRGAALGAGDVVAVKDVSLTVVRGEIVALLGHNGVSCSPYT
jgi:ABC-type multidrug transport system ATPase subunit